MNTTPQRVQWAMQDDLTTVRDDMTAFIEGHGMQRYHGYVN
jgi:hypothetical protein